MKKSVLLLMVAGLFAVMPVLAVELDQKDASVKAYLERCALQSETIDQKISRLQDEIKSGKKTYSAEELKKLEMKLNEANYMLDALNSP